MVSNKLFFAVLACFLSSALAVDPTTTFTTITTIATETVTTPIVVVTSQTQLDDVLTTTSITQTTTLPVVTDLATITLPQQISSTTAAQATQTVINSQCANYKVNFAKNCCPTKYLKKRNSHPHPHPHPNVKKNSKRDGSQQPEKGLYPNEVVETTFQKRDIVGPVTTTAPCSTTAFKDFSTSSVGSTTNIVTNYDFGNGATMRIQDLYAINVCGDVYIDGVYAASTTCPGLADPKLKNSGNENDADKALTEGYGYVFITVPGGRHTVSIKETFSGGQAFYKIISNDQCPAIGYYDQRTATSTITGYTTTTETLQPTTTILNTDLFTLTETLPHATVTATETPITLTTTIIPAPIQTSIDQCQQVSINLSCPKYKSKNMLDSWEKGQLNQYKNKSQKKEIDVTCSNVSGSYYY